MRKFFKSNRIFVLLLFLVGFSDQSFAMLPKLIKQLPFVETAEKEAELLFKQKVENLVESFEVNLKRIMNEMNGRKTFMHPEEKDLFVQLLFLNTRKLRD